MHENLSQKVNRNKPRFDYTPIVGLGYGFFLFITWVLLFTFEIMYIWNFYVHLNFLKYHNIKIFQICISGKYKHEKGHTWNCCYSNKSIYIHIYICLYIPEFSFSQLDPALGFIFFSGILWPELFNHINFILFCWPCLPTSLALPSSSLFLSLLFLLVPAPFSVGHDTKLRF